MDKKHTIVFNGLAKGIKSSIVKVGQFIKESQEQDDFLAKQRVAAMRQAEIATQKAALQTDYELFTNAVGRCLANEHQNCGLQSPRRIEDIMCDDGNNNIRINGTAAPDFSFEANRDFTGSGLRDIMSGGSQNVPAADIEKRLNRTLRKYAVCRGYTFSRVTVDDIPHGKVRITAHDVSLTLEEQLRRNGYSNYGYR